MKYRNIAISGETGTGKTTLSRNLANKLGWKIVNGGEFFRAWHKEHGIPIENTEEVPKEVDNQIDADFQKKMEEDSETVFEMRLAGFFGKDMPEVYRVLCVADFDIAVARAGHRDKQNLDEAIKDAHKRSDGLKKKFKKLYGVEDYLDPKYFDLVVDTTEKSPEEVLQIVLDKLE
jgi:CMP/dCMP kinase